MKKKNRLRRLLLAVVSFFSLSPRHPFSLSSFFFPGSPILVRYARMPVCQDSRRIEQGVTSERVVISVAEIAEA